MMTISTYKSLAQELANLKRRLNDRIDEPIDAVVLFQLILQMHLKMDNSNFDEESFELASKIQNSEI
jgi:hypothetical protein